MHKVKTGAGVSERLGHSSIATTAKIYAHALRGKDIVAAQIFDEIIEKTRAIPAPKVN